MEILYICPRFPYPPDQGDKAVIYNQIKFLSARNRITLLAMAGPGKESVDAGRLAAYCAKIEVFKRRPNFSVQNLVMLASKDWPLSVIRYYSPEMFNRSKALIESAQFDIIHVAFYYMAQYAINKNIAIPKNTAAILDTHNVEYLIYSGYARLTKNLFAALDSLRIKRYELPMYKKFDKCVAFSELDKSNIVKLSQASNVVVNPAAVELPAGAQPQTASEERPDTIIYFGRLNTLPNDDAIRFFYKKIFPLIKKEAPDVKFIIAGKRPSRYAANLARDAGVQLLGLVPSIAEVLKKTALVIVPLRLGGGTRIKILESWAAAKAVVSTSIGAEGVEVSDGRDIIIADSASGFADAVIGLLRSEARRREIGQAAFRKAREYYSPERIIKNLEMIYKTALQEKVR